ncbi:MAG: MotA/TolQ/ExbB proton channel family protein [Rubellimicrobium sp.]|nr:MotA/TolQ/ExbB proton channel family protein [Rubellimicrobium sp.]
MTPLDLSEFNVYTIAVFMALGLLSVVTIAVAFFKVTQFLRLGVGRYRISDDILDSWFGGNADAALRGATERRSVLARVLEAVFTGMRARPGDPGYAEELGRQTAMVELAAMTRGMRLLETVVQAAPLLGLLGTVIGMIDAFGALSEAGGTVDPAALASGIWTSLTTTAVGLTIALVAYFIAAWLESRIEGERHSIETTISVAIHGRVDTGNRRQ